MMWDAETLLCHRCDLMALSLFSIYCVLALYCFIRYRSCCMVVVRATDVTVFIWSEDL